MKKFTPIVFVTIQAILITSFSSYAQMKPKKAAGVGEKNATARSFETASERDLPIRSFSSTDSVKVYTDGLVGNEPDYCPLPTICGNSPCNTQRCRYAIMGCHSLTKTEFDGYKSAYAVPYGYPSGDNYPFYRAVMQQVDCRGQYFVTLAADDERSAQLTSIDPGSNYRFFNIVLFQAIFENGANKLWFYRANKNGHKDFVFEAEYPSGDVEYFDLSSDRPPVTGQ